MNNEKVIKRLATINLLLLPIAVMTNFYFESHLPDHLIEYLNADLEKENSLLEWSVVILMIPVVICHVGALLGVLKSKTWSIKALLISSIAMFIITPFLGPYVNHGLPATLDSLATLSLGALLALLIFGGSKSVEK